MLISVALASGGMLLWPLIAESASAGKLSPTAAVQLINREKAVVIDVGEPHEFAAGHVIGAKSVPFGQLEDKLPGLVKNKALPVIMVCPVGARAARAVGARFAHGAGVQHARLERQFHVDVRLGRRHPVQHGGAGHGNGALNLGDRPACRPVAWVRLFDRAGRRAAHLVERKKPTPAVRVNTLTPI
jgi:rhodanese-related sulfurtransferase